MCPSNENENVNLLTFINVFFAASKLCEFVDLGLLRNEQFGSKLKFYTLLAATLAVVKKSPGLIPGK